MKTLKKQIEKIIDLAEGKTLDVIVTLQSEEESMKDYITVISQTIERRKAAVNPRDLVPPDNKIIQQKNVSHKRKVESLKKTNLLTAKNVIASLQVERITRKSMFSSSWTPQIRTLLKEQVVAQAVARAQAKSDNQ